MNYLSSPDKEELGKLRIHAFGQASTSRFLDDKALAAAIKSLVKELEDVNAELEREKRSHDFNYKSWVAERGRLRQLLKKSPDFDSYCDLCGVGHCCLVRRDAIHWQWCEGDPSPSCWAGDKAAEEGQFKLSSVVADVTCEDCKSHLELSDKLAAALKERNI